MLLLLLRLHTLCFISKFQGAGRLADPPSMVPPPSSHHPDNSSPTGPPGYTAPDTPLNMDAGNQPVYNYALSNLEAIAIFSPPHLTFKIQHQKIQKHKNTKTKKTS
jgi:hypothetical protein